MTKAERKKIENPGRTRVSRIKEVQCGNNEV